MLQYHYTSPEIANSRIGTKKVGADSIYHIASISKLITAFAGLLELTDADWNRPLIDILPGLTPTSSGENDSVFFYQWHKITLWSLATQLSGITSLGIAGADLLPLHLLGEVPDPVTTYGFPPVNISNYGPCWDIKTPLCANDQDFAAEVSRQPPVFLPWSSPEYSDAGFMLLGLAISKITGKSIDAVYRDSIFGPLGMNSSYSRPPTGDAEIARGVVPGSFEETFGSDGGITTPSGGLISTLEDLAKLGVGILNSTLYPSDLTRKWMKPVTHTASLSYSIGAPWEIIRYVHPSTGKVTDLYTKLGDSGFYGGSLVLIPDYGAGFTMLNAGSSANRGTEGNVILDYVSSAVIPALEAQASTEAIRNLAGKYVSTDPEINSSAIVSFDESTVAGAAPSLSLSSWITNNNDTLALFDGSKPRLLPSIRNQSSGAGYVAFRASSNVQFDQYTATSKVGIGPFTREYATNFDWMTADANSGSWHYARLAVNLFVFEVDERGKAVSFIPVSTRAKLKREV